MNIFQDELNWGQIKKDWLKKCNQTINIYKE